MALLIDIQNAAVDPKGDVGTLLRKCKLLAARLGSHPLEDWLIWESNGYPDNIEVPDYRMWPLEIKGHFSGPFGSAIDNAPIPFACIPEKIRKSYQRYQCKQSIASIEVILTDTEKEILSVSTGDLALILGTKVYMGYNCIQTWAEFGKSQLIELVNSVRNRILDFALALWKEEPMAGELESDNVSSIGDTRVTQIFNTTVYSGSANLVGVSNASNIAFNIITKDFFSLERVLRENSVADDDIKDLKVALESDKAPFPNEGFGPKVSSWIASMMQKAAEGSWNIGLGAAGNLLANGIAKYYGL